MKSKFSLSKCIMANKIKERKDGYSLASRKIRRRSTVSGPPLRSKTLAGGATVNEVPPIVKDLASGVSKAVEVQNRYWLALAIAAFFALVPDLGIEAAQGIAMPFGLPTIDASSYVLVSVLIVGSLSLAFAATQASVVRSVRLAHRILDRREEISGLVEGETERDIFDLLTRPSITRVSPIAHVIRGAGVFGVDVATVPAWRQRLSLIVYGVLKLLVATVWVLFPSGALWLAALRYVQAPAASLFPHLWAFIVWPIVAAAAFSLFVTLFLELLFLRQVFRTLWK